MSNRTARLARLEASMPQRKRHLVMIHEGQDPADTLASFKTANSAVRPGDQFCFVHWIWDDEAALERLRAFAQEMD